MSNLLDRASVVLTPTAYNNGEALCVKPDDASGDFQFSRNSAATRVNSQGLVEDVQILSSNLVQNGNFSEEGAEEVSNGSFSNGETDWTLGTGWSIGEDKAVCDGSGRINPTNNSWLSGKTYKFDIEVSDITAGYFRIQNPSVSIYYVNNINSNGTYTYYINTIDANGFVIEAVGFIGSITNISVKEVGQNWGFVNANISIGSNGLEIISQGGNRPQANQNVSGLTIGNKYKLSAVAKRGSCVEPVEIEIAGIGSTVETNKNNTTEFSNIFYEFIATSTIHTIQAKIDDGASTIGETAFFKSVSIIEITDDTNLPRISYENFSYDGSGNIVPDSGCGSWLFEPQSTNVIEYSNDYADSYWQKLTSGSGVAPIITSNYAISPDGTQNADRIQFDASTSGSSSDRSRIRATLTLTDNADYTFSFYAKSTNGTDQKISILFDNSQISVKTITSEWQRYEATATQTGTGSFCGLDLRSNNASTSDILVYGIQIEEQTYSTSLIPTDGTSVTRNQDVCIGGGSAASMNSTEGVLYFEFKPNNTNTYTFSVSDGGTSNFTQLYVQNGGNNVRYRVSSGGVVQFDNNVATAVNLTLNNKYALKWKANNFSLWLNGTKINSQTTGLTPIGLNEIDFNSVFTFTGQNVFGKTKCLAVWKEALTDTELQELTTI